MFAQTLAVRRADEFGWNPALSTGHAALDRQLPGGGWPLDGMVEVLQARWDQPFWQLLLPALAQVAQPHAGLVVLVGAPYEPFGPSLAAQGLPGDRLLCVRAAKPAARLWAAEQALRCADVAAVMAWLPQARSMELRRLQVAQRQGQLLFVFRGLNVRGESSPARLRLQLQPAASQALEVHILKRRGPPLQAPIVLPAQPERLLALLASRRGKTVAAPPALSTERRSHVLDRPVPQS